MLHQIGAQNISVSIHPGDRVFGHGFFVHCHIGNICSHFRKGILYRSVYRIVTRKLPACERVADSLILRLFCRLIASVDRNCAFIEGLSSLKHRCSVIVNKCDLVLTDGRVDSGVDDRIRIGFQNLSECFPAFYECLCFVILLPAGKYITIFIIRRPGRLSGISRNTVQSDIGIIQLRVIVLIPDHLVGGFSHPDPCPGDRHRRLCLMRREHGELFCHIDGSCPVTRVRVGSGGRAVQRPDIIAVLIHVRFGQKCDNITFVVDRLIHRKLLSKSRRKRDILRP